MVLELVLGGSRGGSRGGSGHGKTTKLQTIFSPPMRWLTETLHPSAATPAPPLSNFTTPCGPTSQTFCPPLSLRWTTSPPAWYSHGQQEEEDAAGVGDGGQAPPGLHQVAQGTEQGDAHRKTHAGQRTCTAKTTFGDQGVRGQGSRRGRYLCRLCRGRF